MLLGPLALWQNARYSGYWAARPFSRHFVIALSTVALLCVTPVHSNRCKVDAARFESLDNATCLPRDYRDINEVTATCTTTVTVLFSCRCKDYTGLIGGNSVQRPSYCLATAPVRTGDYTANLQLGVCTEGECQTSTFTTNLAVDLRDDITAERLNMPALPGCTREEFTVKNIFSPLASCEFFCDGRDNKPVNDGSPCVLEWSQRVFGGAQVQLTGQCWNGICKFPSPVIAPPELGCIDRELLTSETGIMSECSFPCGRGTQNRENGVTCTIQPATPFYPAVVGICLKGICREIVEVKNQPLGFAEEKVLVGSACVYVARNQLTQRRKGAVCVLQRSRLRGLPQLLGYCSRGHCRSLPPYRPSPQRFKLKECQLRDVRLTSKLQVAESCTVTCRNYQTERRMNGILCVLYYRTFGCHVFRTCSAFTIGQCYHGHCIRTSESWDVHV